MQLR
ncbi:hypothetical protein IEO21_09552 [Rhodonia placenta]